MNAIYLRRARKLHVKEGDAHTSLNYVTTLQKNIESLGFALSEPLLKRLQTLPLEKLDAFYKTLVKDLQAMVGAHRVFKPFYPNFPLQVMKMSEAELYLNAILHYITRQTPAFPKEKRSPLSEPTNLRVIELGSREDFETIFTRLAAAKTSLSPQDKEDVIWFVTQYRDDIVRLLPAEIPSKENLALIGAQLILHTTVAPAVLRDRVKTATDVLRLAVALSGGDVSLSEPVKFGRFTRSQRKMLLAWLEQCGDPTEDMLRWKEPWKRLGERLHPGDYSDAFPKTYAAFRTLRDALPFTTFNSTIERNLRQGNTTEIFKLLQTRPGDLARRLDHLIRVDQAPRRVLQSFEHLAGRVSTPVMLQVMTHFRHRHEARPLRTFFPKGDVAKVQAVPNKLPALDPAVTGRLVATCEKNLVARFSRLPPLGKCYLDPALVNYLVPFSQRSAAKSLRTLVRGSRLPLPAGKVLRFFVWWRNGSSRVDIDLSAALFDANFQYIDVVSYYNLKNFGGHHSGDIVDAPTGAAEFIDLDLERTRAGKVRFIVMSLNSFTEQPYCDLPECFAGWMSRAEPNSGEIFEPRTVQDKVDVASNTRICIPAIFDLQEGQVIWADIALRKHPLWNNVQNNLSGVSLMLRALHGLAKTNLHTLFSLHIQARGTLVSNKREANTVFSVSEGITPFDLDRIASEFM